MSTQEEDKFPNLPHNIVDYIIFGKVNLNWY